MEKASADKLAPGKGLLERAVPGKALPAIPAKRYFTIGEVSELCGVKPYVLRYWEQEFTQLKPMKRRGNRRYYQHHEVLLIRRIRDLLYDQGFTISGARNRLTDAQEVPADDEEAEGELALTAGEDTVATAEAMTSGPAAVIEPTPAGSAAFRAEPLSVAQIRAELQAIRELLSEPFV